MNLNEYLDDFIYKGLKELGIRFWKNGDELYFKYPEGLEGDGRGKLYRLIREHEKAILSRL